MTYHHTPGHSVADIYEEYLADGEFWRTAIETGMSWHRVIENGEYPAHWTLTRLAVEEAYADGGLDSEDEFLMEAVKSNLRRIWRREENHHTAAPPYVWDIYAEYLERSRLQQAMIDSRKRWERIMARGKASVAARLNSVAVEHPIEAEEGWLGSTDSESDDPGGWAR